MPQNSNIKHSRNLVKLSFQLDDPKIKFFFDRGSMPQKFYNEMISAVHVAIKSNQYISAFLDEFWDDDAAIRYQKMLHETLQPEGERLLTTDEVDLYTAFVGKAGLTEQEFLDNFSVIESTLAADEDKRVDIQTKIAEEIRNG